jgi:hypothetical protein
MFVDKEDQTLVIDPRNREKLKKAIDTFYALIELTWPDVEWAYVAEQTSRISNGLEASNIIALQVKQIMSDNQITILPFNMRDM